MRSLVTSRQRRRLVSTVVAVATAHLSMTSSAGNSLDVMFSHTQAQMGTTPTQNYVTGGSFSMRVPQKTFQLANIDPPRASFGCSGIDLHLGSFSFISLDAFKDMLRKVAQAAPGYFLHLAIQTMCNPCSNLLTWFQELMAALNAGQLNSCAVSKTISNTLFTSMFKSTDIDSSAEAQRAYNKASEDTVFGSQSDWYVSLRDQLSKLGGLLNGETQAAKNKANAQQGRGNAFVVSAVRNGIDDKFDLTMYGPRGFYDALPFMMSVYGTSVRPYIDPDTDTSVQTLPDGSKVPDGMTIHPGTLSVTQFFQGAAGSNQLILTCSPDATVGDLFTCNKVVPELWTSYATRNPAAFAGTQAWAHKILFGSDDINSPEIVGGLLQRVQTGDTNLTIQERSFLLVAPTGSLRLMMEVKYDARALRALGRRLTDIVGMLAAVTMARQLQAIYAELSGTSKNSSPGVPDDAKFVRLAVEKHMEERAKSFDAEVAIFENQVMDRGARDMQDLVARIGHIRALTPNFAYNPKAR